MGGIGEVVSDSGLHQPMAGERGPSGKNAITLVRLSDMAQLLAVLRAIRTELTAIRLGMIDAGMCNEVNARDLEAAAATA